MHTVVIMFCGPFYGSYPFHFGRIDRAIALAREHRCPLVICGDGTGGTELEAFLARARARGVPLPMARYNGKRNTLGDAISAAAVLSAEFPHVTRAYLVTDWYHVPRASIRLAHKLSRQGMGHVTVVPAPVWDHLLGGLRRLPGELLGSWHALLRLPQPPKRRRRRSPRRNPLRHLLRYRLFR